MNIKKKILIASSLVLLAHCFCTQQQVVATVFEGDEVDDDVEAAADEAQESEKQVSSV